jgi:short-subunit dehydrogenase
MQKIILITGASSGMGKETALRLLSQGHKVYAAARRLENMQDIKAKGGVPVKMDIAEEKDIQATVDQVLAAEGRIDVLWNNAGYGLFGTVEEVDIPTARKQFEVNLFGLASLTQKIIPHMRKAGSGTIINTSSMGGKMYSPLGAWYHATKHALEGWSDCLRLELKQFNIHVVVLEPGIIATEFGDVSQGPLLNYSGNGPYQQLAKAVAKASQDFYEKPGAASPPSVIADAVSQIVNSKKPKTRYRVGKLAKPMVWMRVFLGDRIFDSAVMGFAK